MAIPSTNIGVVNLANVGTVGFVGISLPFACNSFVIKARTSTTVLYYYAPKTYLPGSPAYITIPAGTSLTVEVRGSEKDTSVGFVRTASGIDTVEVLCVG